MPALGGMTLPGRGALGGSWADAQRHIRHPSRAVSGTTSGPLSCPRGAIAASHRRRTPARPRFPRAWHMPGLSLFLYACRTTAIPPQRPRRATFHESSNVHFTVLEAVPFTGPTRPALRNPGMHWSCRVLMEQAGPLLPMHRRTAPLRSPQDDPYQGHRTGPDGRGCAGSPPPQSASQLC